MADEDRIMLDPATLRRLATVIRGSSDGFFDDATPPAFRTGFLAGWDAACRSFLAVADEIEAL